MRLPNFVKSVFPSLGIIELLAEVNRLALANKAEEALALLEEKAGLGEEDYRAPQRLREKLNPWLEQLPDIFAATYVSVLVGTLGMVRRHRNGLLVLEAYLELEPNDYRSVEHLALKLRTRLGGLQEDLQFSILFVHIGSLNILGRVSEAMALLRSDLELWPESQQAPVELVQLFEAKLLQRLRNLMPDTAAAYLNLAAMSLDELGVGNDGVRALESYLNLEPSDYESVERLRYKLQPWLESLQSPIAGVMSLVALAARLERAGDGAKCLSLLEWFIGIQRTDYQHVDELARKWQAFHDGYPPDIGATAWRVWSGTLAANGRLQDALALIEADSGLRPVDFRSTEEVAAKLEGRLDGLQVDTRSAYIYSLASDLTAVGQRERACLIVDWYLRGYKNFWRIPDAGDPGVAHVIPLLHLWLEERANVDPNFTWALCEQSVLYLRRSLLLPEMKFEDRRDFIRYVDSLRRDILQAGHHWTAKGALAEAEKKRPLHVQLWDAELSQRLLFEKFLLTRIEPIILAEEPEDRWPLDEEEPKEYEDYLPDPNQCLEKDLLRLLERRSDRNWESARSLAKTETKSGEELPPAEEWLLEAETIVRGGVTEALLAQTLGAGALLLRAGFRADGALVWAALENKDGRELRVAATGVGTNRDFGRLRWTCFRHDLGLLMASSQHSLKKSESPGRVMTEREGLVKVLGDALAMVDQALDRARTPEGADGEWRKDIEKALEVCDSPKSSIGEYEQLGTRLRAMLSPLPDAASWPDWYDFLQAEVSKLRASVARHQEAFNRGESLNPFEEIDEVTRAYLADVAEIWPLNALADELKPEHDLVFQLEDTLQAVPIAHYPLPDGTPLYAKVRSTRVSLSLLMTVLQERTEKQFDTSAKRLLAVSYFEPEDRLGGEDRGVASYAKWLHHGQRWLASRDEMNEMTCFNAAEIPPGAAGAVRAALQKYQSFQTVTVCGHGSAHEAGIRLADGVWQGNGCDWRGVNFLLLISCSVGRLEQSGDQDVEGLCVQLALHRARAVLACRWPVIAPQAIAFTNEVVAQYLALRRQADEGKTSREHLRARAVSLARHRFLQGGNRRAQGEIVRLNTAAAFELYGLG